MGEKIVNTNPHRVYAGDLRLAPGEVRELDGDALSNAKSINGVEKASKEHEEAYAASRADSNTDLGHDAKLSAARAAANEELRVSATAVPLQRVIGDDDAPYGPPSGTITTKQAVARESEENHRAFAENQHVDGPQEGMSDVQADQAERQVVVEELTEKLNEEEGTPQGGRRDSLKPRSAGRSKPDAKASAKPKNDE